MQEQQSLFETPQDRLLKELAKTDPNALTPLQALAKIAKWVEISKGR